MSAPARAMLCRIVPLFALVLLALGSAHADLRQKTILPPAIAIEPLLRHGTEKPFVVARPLGTRIALQNTELSQQLTHRRSLARRQWEVMRRQRVGAHFIAPGTRISAGCSFHFDD